MNRCSALWGSCGVVGRNVASMGGSVEYCEAVLEQCGAVWSSVTHVTHHFNFSGFYLPII